MPFRFFIISMVLALLVLTSPAVIAQQPPRTQAPKAAAAREASMNVLSIIPAQGAPGINVTLYGSGFSGKTTAYLGNQEIPATVLGPKQLSFEIPNLEPGLYALFLKREDGTTSKVYSFSILAQKPVATSLNPDRIDMCAARDREVTISGEHFKENSQILFDGAAIRGRFLGKTAIAFSVPQVYAGLHQVQVKNTEDTISGVLGLLISSTPEISSITQGEEHVNYYNLTIEGRNFQQNSQVVIIEESTVEQMGGASTVESRRLGTGTPSALQREKIIYVNCNRIIYQRYPYSTALKNFRVQIVNPNGEESAVVSVTAP